MALRVPLILCLLLVSSYAGVMGSSFLGIPHIDYVFENFEVPPPDNCTAAGDLLPDPDDCKKFYVCTDADNVLPVPQPCGDAMLCFEPATSTCIDDSTKCDPICAENGGGGTCTFACPAAPDLPAVIAKQDDCTKYILCFDARGQVEIPCSDPTKPYFNGAECVADQAECCNCQAPACADTPAFAVFPDPENCHSYFTCLAADGTNYELVGPTECPDGGKFDGTTCVPDDGCTPACDLGGGGSSPSIDDTTPAGEVTTPGGDSTTDSSGATTPSGGTSSGDTSSDSSGATTAGPTTTDDGCTEPADFTCPAKGYYAYCETCVQSYLKCDSAGSTPSLGSCTGDLVFNPAPEYPFCVRPENCPFSR